MNECLIIPCSSRKKSFDKPMPAIELFDGVLARVVRKRSPGLPVFIMSAKYGLIPSTELIEQYEISPEDVLSRDFVIEKVVNNWLQITNGVPNKFDTIWHITRGASYKAIRILEQWSTLKDIIGEDVEMGHNIGVRLRELKAFCLARPAFGDIDLDHLTAMYKKLQSEGKLQS